jgi:uncharacterized protein (DUF1778 family)
VRLITAAIKRDVGCTDMRAYDLVMAASKLERVELRVPAAEKRLYALAAARSAESVSEFLRRAARDEAQRALAEETTIRLTDEEALRLIAALDADAHDQLADLAKHAAAFGE